MCHLTTTIDQPHERSPLLHSCTIQSTHFKIDIHACDITVRRLKPPARPGQRIGQLLSMLLYAVWVLGVALVIIESIQTPMFCFVLVAQAYWVMLLHVVLIDLWKPSVTAVSLSASKGLCSVNRNLFASTITLPISELRFFRVGVAVQHTGANNVDSNDGRRFSLNIVTIGEGMLCFDEQDAAELDMVVTRLNGALQEARIAKERMETPMIEEQCEFRTRSVGPIDLRSQLPTDSLLCIREAPEHSDLIIEKRQNRSGLAKRVIVLLLWGCEWFGFLLYVSSSNAELSGWQIAANPGCIMGTSLWGAYLCYVLCGYTQKIVWSLNGDKVKSWDSLFSFRFTKVRSHSLDGLNLELQREARSNASRNCSQGSLVASLDSGGRCYRVVFSQNDVCIPEGLDNLTKGEAQHLIFLIRVKFPYLIANGYAEESCEEVC